MLHKIKYKKCQKDVFSQKCFRKMLIFKKRNEWDQISKLLFHCTIENVMANKNEFQQV